jgi:recombination protein RecA
MAKKATKKETKGKSVPIYLGTLEKKYKKEYGKIVYSGLDVLETRRNHKLLSITPSLDMALGGGIKEGTVIILSGDEGSGKTTLALHMAAKHQSDPDFTQPNGTKGRPVFYFNSEARLDEKHFSGIKGLDPEKLVVIQKDPLGKIIPAEVFLDSSISIMGDPANKGAMLILDSSSVLIPQSELDEDIRATRNTLPRLLALWCKKFCQIIPDNDITLIVITHLITDTSPQGRGRKIPDCGKKIRFAADTILKADYITRWKKSDSDPDHIGQQIHWSIDKSSMASSIKKVDSWLRYGIGMDENKEALDIALDLGLIDCSGSWYSPFGEEGDKIQGMSNFLDWVDENPEYMLGVKEKIKELI